MVTQKKKKKNKNQTGPPPFNSSAWFEFVSPARQDFALPLQRGYLLEKLGNVGFRQQSLDTPAVGEQDETVKRGKSDA